MNNRKIRMTGGLFALFFIAQSFLFSAHADSYLYDLDGKSVAAPDAYKVSRVFTGEDFGAGALSSPEDLFVDNQNRIYIADTGNNRVLVLDEGFRLLQSIEEVTAGGTVSSLNQPKGVYARDGLIYIADTGNARVVAVDESGAIKRSLTKEELFAVNDKTQFQPEKVAVDKDGGVYVVDRSIYQGIIQYDSENHFIGYFAPNEVTVTAGVLLLNLWKSIFSDEQVDSMEKILPVPYSSLYIGADGFTYAVSADVSDSRAIKRLNTLGNNILKSAGSEAASFGDLETEFESGKELTSQFIDIHTDNEGIIAVADSRRGRVFLYDRDANLLAVFGGTGAYAGSFQKLAAVDKLGDTYLTLDGLKNSISVFKPTEYIRKVYEALSFYNRGMYLESVSLWEKVLHENSHFTVAYRGIGRAYLQDKKYEQAMEMLKEGGDPYFYSLALKEYRKEFVRTYFIWIVAGSIVFFTGLYRGIKVLRRWILRKGAPK